MWWCEVQSEIPQLEVITAIGDADFEDYIAQLLYSQGWNIVYRALEMDALINYVANRPQELRTIIVFKSDLLNFDQVRLDDLASSTFTCINLDEVPNTAHDVMLHIRSQIRLPLISGAKSEVTTPFKNEKKFKTILVTGTHGAPGRTTIALNLAQEKKYQIMDFDFKAPALRYLQENLNLEIDIKNLESEKPREYLAESDCIVDIGALGPLDELVNDRRWNAALLNSVLESTSNLIYVCRPNNLSMQRLAKFISEFPILLRKIPLTYVFNLAGNSREERYLEKQFIKMMAGENYLVIPSDSRIANIVSSRNKTIGKLASLIP